MEYCLKTKLSLICLAKNNIVVNNYIDLNPFTLFTILIFLSLIPLFDKNCTLKGYLREALTSNFKFMKFYLIEHKILRIPTKRIAGNITLASNFENL